MGEGALAWCYSILFIICCRKSKVALFLFVGGGGGGVLGAGVVRGVVGECRVYFDVSEK